MSGGRLAERVAYTAGHPRPSLHASLTGGYHICMDPATRALIESLHRRAVCKYVLALTGGGTTAAALLLNVPGGSRTILEVVVPYSERALSEFLGRPPEQFCSSATTLALARRALERARALAPGEPVAGVGCTASLATDRPKKGDHRFHLAVVRDDVPGLVLSLTLLKGQRDREGEEAVLDAVLFNALAELLEVEERVPVPLLPGEVIERQTGDASPLAPLVSGTPGAAPVCVEADGRLTVGAARPRVLLPGAFNPLHHAHLALADEAARRLGVPTAFELSVSHVDKGTMSMAELRQRAAQFASRAPLWVTRAPTVVEKAALFPGVVFVIGADMAARVIAPRYYPEGEAGVEAALAALRGYGCRFLVACRSEADGRCLGLEDLGIPEAGRDLFEPIPRSEFWIDVSSTQLREQSSASNQT
ncbi:MAG: hypothetical protein L0Z62_37135 [Gemmataceae bacterium]|nr:hypothetical protein [Gemmataceae bacterium]